MYILYVERSRNRRRDKVDFTHSNDKIVNPNIPWYLKIVLRALEADCSSTHSRMDARNLTALGMGTPAKAYAQLGSRCGDSSTDAHRNGIRDNTCCAECIKQVGAPLTTTG